MQRLAGIYMLQLQARLVAQGQSSGIERTACRAATRGLGALPRTCADPGLPHCGLDFGPRVTVPVLRLFWLLVLRTFQYSHQLVLLTCVCRHCWCL